MKDKYKIKMVWRTQYNLEFHSSSSPKAEETLTLLAQLQLSSVWGIIALAIL